MRFTQSLIWILWNIFLALVPVGLGYGIGMIEKSERRHGLWTKLLIGVLGVMWIIFMPNTCYLLTEWRHFLEMLGYSDLHTRWTYDSDARLILMALTLFYMCYSGIGMLTFTLAIRPIVRIAKDRGLVLWVWGMPFFFLMSIGVYLGLIHRFNSWDLLNQFRGIMDNIYQLTQRPTLSAYIIFFACFLWLMYMVVDIWVDGFVHRFLWIEKDCDQS